MTVAGQPAVAYSYDTADRLTGITQGSSSVGFGYDAAARRTSLTLPNGIVVESAYDTASRLIGLAYKLGTTALGALSYTYDAAGDRMQLGATWARTGLPQPVATTSYDANNQQLGFGGATMTFDPNGNLATRVDGSGTTTYTWNARDQLTGLSGPGLAATFGYDGLRRRRTKTINGARTDFLYDGLNPIQEGILPAAPSANLLTGLGIDEFLTRTDTAGARHLLSDALGSTLALSDSTGALSTEYTYEPFGETTFTGASSPSAFQYTSRENDGDGLYYYRARYYHPELGRFVAEDPVGLLGGINLYGYVDGNPIMNGDPLGLYSFNFSRDPVRVKPEEDPSEFPGGTNPTIRILPPCHVWLGREDGVVGPGGDRGPGQPPQWDQTRGGGGLIPNIVVVERDGTIRCKGGPCTLPGMHRKFTPDPKDNMNWMPPSNPSILPGARPMDPGLCAPKESKSAR
jgi:RHS repeat-associated protein